MNIFPTQLHRRKSTSLKVCFDVWSVRLVMLVLGVSVLIPAQVHAASTKVVFLTTTGSGTWTVPADFISLVSVEVIGGGGGGRTAVSATGGAGGGAGAYAKITSMTGFTMGANISYSVATSGTAGLAAGDSVFGSTTLGACVTAGSGACVGAKGGAGGTGLTAAAGGTAAASVGTTLFAGGNSGTGNANGGFGGGGGAAGPTGAGKVGGNGRTAGGGDDGGGGGGGSNGGSSSVGAIGTTAGGAGGNGTGGTGGGTAGTSAAGGNGTQNTGAGGGGGDSGFGGGNGATSTVWTQTADSATTGSGGGGGGAGSGAGGNGGTGGQYGGGGGAGNTGGTGGQGIIVITYTASAVFSITGTLYSDEGVTQITTGKTIKIAIGTSTPGVYSTTTNSGTGVFSFSILADVATGTPFTIWVDNDATTRAARVSKASSTISGALNNGDLFQNRVIITHEGITGTTTRIADMAFYDNDDDADLQFNASSTASTFTVFPGNELYVAPGKHFVPGGTVTVLGNASSSIFDGSLRLKASSTFEQSATTTLAGSFSASTSANYLKSAGGLLFNATTTGKVIVGGTVGGGLSDVTFSGVGGGWTFSNIASTSNFTVATGTVTAPSVLSIRGTYSNSDTYISNGGDMFFTATNSMATGTLAGTSALGNVALKPVGDVATWTTQAAASDNRWYSVAYGNGTFVAVSIDGTNRVMTSPNGINWTAHASANEAALWRSVTYGTSSFVAVAITGEVMTSVDNGASWSLQTAAEANAWVSVTYGNGLFVAVAYSGGTNRVMTSPNGINWSAQSAAGNDDGWYDVEYGEGLFVAVGEGPDRVMTSPDGLTWTVQSLANDTNSWINVTYGNGIFIAAGVFALMTSPDGLTWTMRTNPAFSIWTGLTYGDGLFVAVAQDSIDSSHYRTMTSPDGVTWAAKQSSLESNEWTSVAYGAGTFVAVGSSSPASTNRVMTATNLDSSLTLGGASASTTNLTVTASTTLYAPRDLTVAGNYQNAGTFTQSSGTTVFSGTAKTLSGVGNSTLANVNITGTIDAASLIRATTTDLTIASGASFVAPNLLTVAGNYQNSGTFTAGSGTTTFSGTTKTIAGTLTGTSALGNVQITGSLTASNNASTTNLSIQSGGTLTAPPLLSVAGNYINSGTLTAGSGTTTFSGTLQQIATGTMTGTSAFSNLQITNTSGDGVITQSVVVGAAASTTNTFSMTPGTSAAFVAGATSTFQNMNLRGSYPSRVYLRSTVPGTQWQLEVPGTQELVTYVDVRDSNNVSATITCSGVCFDSGNNINWTFGTATSSGNYLTLADHSAGQATNLFSFQNQNDALLYRFGMTAATETAIVDDVVLSLFGLRGVDTSEVTDLRLYLDSNNDGALDGGDLQVLGAGIMAIQEESGTITFSTGTTSVATTSTQNYLVTADTVAIDNNDSLNIQLRTTGVQASGLTTSLPSVIAGDVSAVQHIRSTAGGSSAANRSLIGGDGPAGAGIETGGDGGGGGNSSEVGQENDGANIAPDPDFSRPTSGGSPHNEWTGGANGYVSDGVYATAASANLRQTYGGFGFVIPGGNLIQGIQIKLDGSGTTAAGTLQVGLSWDGGNTITTLEATPTLTGSDIVYNLGGLTNLWGRSWTAAELGDGNFRVRIVAQPSSNTVRLDAVEVRVYHTAGGGGGGGGGEI